MKLVVQRVKNAELKVDNKTVAKIGVGIVAYIGFGEQDTTYDFKFYLNKLAGLRIFEDNNGKLNLNLTQANGQILLVPNFTLYGDCSHGFRPSFTEALKPEIAKQHFNKFVEDLNTLLPNKVFSGVFGADMQITQTNDGPITIII